MVPPILPWLACAVANRASRPRKKPSGLSPWRGHFSGASRRPEPRRLLFSHEHLRPFQRRRWNVAPQLRHSQLVKSDSCASFFCTCCSLPLTRPNATIRGVGYLRPTFFRPQLRPDRARARAISSAINAAASGSPVPRPQPQTAWRASGASWANPSPHPALFALSRFSLRAFLPVNCSQRRTATSQ